MLIWHYRTTQLKRENTLVIHLGYTRVTITSEELKFNDGDFIIEILR